jgi:hypothetical protein
MRIQFRPVQRAAKATLSVIIALPLAGCATGFSARSVPTPVSRIKPTVSLTLIPPSPVTDQITLDIRAGVRNSSQSAANCELTFYLDSETPANLLHRTHLDIGGGEAKAALFRWPAKGHAGRHRIVLVARWSKNTFRAERSLNIVASQFRSTLRIGGAWAGFYHWSEEEGRPWNAEIAKMTDEQWRQIVRAMDEIGMNVLVNGEMFRNQQNYGKHNIDRDGYPGRAFYPSKLYSARMPIVAQDPLEKIMAEADARATSVFVGVGNYAWRDYSAGSLAWHKKVAAELWERYGHHASFYGWYIVEEQQGSLGSEQERKEMIEFFRELAAWVRRFAPDKPVMLAPGADHLPGAEEAYRDLLPHLDILCAQIQRMPRGDLSGEEAARLLQRLCDECGTHLWLDTEVFVFDKQGALLPRPIEEITAELRRFSGFEKVLCYQFPGLMTAPWMSHQLGGPAAVKLFSDYKHYLESTGSSSTLSGR